MQQILRFSISGILGVLITAALFLGMLSLLSGKKATTQTEDVNINFSYVKDFKEPEVTPKTKRELPEQQEVTQAPTTQQLAMDPIDTPEVSIPDTGITGNDFNVIQSIGIPGDGYRGGDFVQGEPGTIKTAIPPMYPPKEQEQRIEGWVKLLIEVNEFGAVSSAKVLQAKPARSFNAAAIKAVKKWTFYPKTVDGKPIPFQVTQTIEFQLEE